MQSTILSHHDIQRLPADRHTMFQRSQLRHHGHETRILTLHPHFLPDLDLLALVAKNQVSLVMLGLFGPQAETFAKVEAREGVGGRG